MKQFAKKLLVAAVIAIAKKVPEKRQNCIKCIFNTQKEKFGFLKTFLIKLNTNQ
jgi:hypothetical protein